MLLRLALPLLILRLGLLSACGKPPEPTVSLYRAVQLGDLDQIKRHIFWGSDLNQTGPDGDLPLHVAARSGKVGIARELADHGADLEARNAAGLTAMDLALAEGKTQVAEQLLESGATLDPQQALVRLIDTGVSDRDSIDLLVRRGADLDLADPDGRTPMQIAVAGDHLEAAKRLLQRGADVNRADQVGNTPLDLAQGLDPRTDDRAEIITLLRQYGARAGSGASTQEQPR